MESSKLWSLPVECRLLILRLAIFDGSEIIVHHCGVLNSNLAADKTVLEIPHNSIALVHIRRTCSQLNREASATFEREHRMMRRSVLVNLSDAPHVIPGGGNVPLLPPQQLMVVQPIVLEHLSKIYIKAPFVFSEIIDTRVFITTTGEGPEDLVEVHDLLVATLCFEKVSKAAEGAANKQKVACCWELQRHQSTFHFVNAGDGRPRGFVLPDEKKRCLETMIQMAASRTNASLVSIDNVAALGSLQGQILELFKHAQYLFFHVHRHRRLRFYKVKIYTLYRAMLVDWECGFDVKSGEKPDVDRAVQWALQYCE